MRKLTLITFVLLSINVFSQTKIGIQAAFKGKTFDIGLVGTYYEKSDIGIYMDAKLDIRSFKSVTTHVGVVYDWHEFVQPYVCVGLRAAENPSLNVGGGLFIGGRENKVNWVQGFEYSKHGLNITLGLLIRL